MIPDKNLENRISLDTRALEGAEAAASRKEDATISGGAWSCNFRCLESTPRVPVGDERLTSGFSSTSDLFPSFWSNVTMRRSCGFAAEPRTFAGAPFAAADTDPLISRVEAPGFLDFSFIRYSNNIRFCARPLPVSPSAVPCVPFCARFSALAWSVSDFSTSLFPTCSSTRFFNSSRQSGRIDPSDSFRELEIANLIGSRGARTVEPGAFGSFST